MKSWVYDLPYKDGLTGKTTYVGKGWGWVDFAKTSERIGEIFAYHPSQEKSDQIINVETVKILYIDQDRKLSRHFHLSKKEFFIMALGEILVEIWDKNAVKTEFLMKEGDRVFIDAGVQHRMTGIGKNNILIEVSTLDTPEDSYRIEKGD